MSSYMMIAKPSSYTDFVYTLLSLTGATTRVKMANILIKIHLQSSFFLSSYSTFFKEYRILFLC